MECNGESVYFILYLSEYMPANLLLKYEDKQAILNESTLNLTKFTSTRVEGTVDCLRDGLLYTSIPQNGNWQAVVDGKAVKTELVGDCMLAVPLTAGSHSVVFVYHNSAFSLGWKLSLACAAVFAGLIATCYRPIIPKKPGKFARDGRKQGGQEN